MLLPNFRSSGGGADFGSGYSLAAEARVIEAADAQTASDYAELILGQRLIVTRT